MVLLSADVTRQIKHGIAVLKRGGVIAFPTDTVYGLGARFDSREAVDRIYRIKGRPEKMALPLLLADISQLNSVARVVPDTAWKLARNFLPGALTLVLVKSKSVPDFVTGSGQTVAVRVPAHPVPLALIKGTGVPVIGTSANLSGQPSAVTAEEARLQLRDKIDMVIEGTCPAGRESTIVDVTGNRPVVLREGAIPLRELKRICPDITVKEGE